MVDWNDLVVRIIICAVMALVSMELVALWSVYRGSNQSLRAVDSHGGIDCRRPGVDRQVHPAGQGEDNET